MKFKPGKLYELRDQNGWPYWFAHENPKIDLEKNLEQGDVILFLKKGYYSKSGIKFNQIIFLGPNGKICKLMIRVGRWEIIRNGFKEVGSSC